MSSNYKIAIVGTRYKCPNLHSIDLNRHPSDNVSLYSSYDLFLCSNDIDKSIERINSGKYIEKQKSKSINGFTKLNRKGR